MHKRFHDFMTPLKETHFSLRDYVDFPKVSANVESIAIKLNQLNYLIGQEDMAMAVKRLWEENPKVFSVLDVLIAVRTKDKKKAIDDDGNTLLISDYFTSPESVTVFLNQTGLTEVFRTKQIKNLVDYVFGIEVGLDSNARKNRGGHIMEGLVATILTKHGVKFEKEVYCSRFPDIVKALGADNKRFDFVISTPFKTYLIEANFYTGGGSKLNEVARSYSELAPKINAVPGFEFVWITDGIGWESARNKLEEAFAHISSVYNLTNIQEFISRVKYD
ncbi:restriction endonuclease [Barnesiella sp. WM24]|uniref:type II restriction endonuclease n=1 Tax=Barnesiella sp. WM24 TaxID=2558278 RepID=UPI001072B9C6|nr:type II restriction endonuclease [Barnesiella sp. WM24]TFU93021.1 restriction endonuclease [Barnesiella sp. WM24]